jgi:hypothetical protein
MLRYEYFILNHSIINNQTPEITEEKYSPQEHTSIMFERIHLSPHLPSLVSNKGPVYPTPPSGYLNVLAVMIILKRTLKEYVLRF